MRGTSETWWRPERPDLTLPVRVDPAGLTGPTRSQARGLGWRRSSRGLYVPAEVSDEPVEQRIVEAAAVLPPGTAVTGWAGLRWAGGFWFDGLAGDAATRLPVTLATGDSTIAAQPGFEISEEHLRHYDLTELDGLPITTPVRSAAYLMRHARTLEEAVVALDMAAYNDLVSAGEMAAYVPMMPAWTGIGLCRDGTAIAEENAWSPKEVGMRLVWTLVAGFPRPLANHPVFDRWGNHLGTPDLLDEEAGVALEYNGALHLVDTQNRRDRDRDEVFRRVGLEVLTVLAGDHDRALLAERMTDVRRRARFAAAAGRGWTTRLPAWWIPTFTVDQRRNLTPAERARLLRLRRTPG